MRARARQSEVALLRREGLYRSRISEWRKKREAGELLGLAPRKRGRPCKPRNALKPEVERLRRENARLQEELRKARIIIDVQKKVSEMLENSLLDGDESTDWKAAEELGQQVGIVAACQALVVSRATLYRRRSLASP